MLCLPATYEDSFYIVGFDPGTHTLGVGALEVDIRSFKIRSFTAHTLVATKLMDDEDWLVHGHGHMYARTHAHRVKIVQLLQHYRPMSVACEDAFFSRRTPGAYAPLLASINSIRQAVLDWDPAKPIALIEASVIKSAVRAKNGSKDAVLDALLVLDEFKVPTTTPLTTLTEHSRDALAIAYTRLKHMR